MESFVYSMTGWIHFLASCIAPITGTMVLAMKKGTNTHIKTGYAYAVSMVIVNATAFMIYRLLVDLEFFTERRSSADLPSWPE